MQNKSINQLSQYLPDTTAKDTRKFTDSAENKKRMLREWNSGKKTPSDEKLATFLKNLVDNENSDEHIYLLWLCKLAIAIGKLQQEILKLDNIDLKEFTAMFGKYKLYYVGIKNRAT